MAIDGGVIFIKILPDMKAFAGAVSTGLNKNQAAFKKAGASLTKFVTLPLVAAGAASVKLAYDFEKTMSQISGLAGQSREQVSQWGNEILDLAPKLGRAPNELGKALYFVASSGIEASKAMGVVEVSGKAAAAGLGDTEVVADAVTSAMNSYRAANLSAAEATDVLTATVREGKGEASAIAPVLGSLLPTASELGIEFNEVGAALASMTVVGDSAAIAATKVNAIMSALLKVTPQSADAFESVGLNVSDLRDELGSEGLLPTLTKVKDAVGGNIEVLAEMFPNVRALRGVLSLVGVNAEKAAEIFDKLGDSTGALDHAFKEASDRVGFAFDQALASIQVSAIRLGDVLLPVVAGIVKGFAALIDVFTSLPAPIRNFGIVLLGAAAALGPFLKLLGSAPNIVKTLGSNITRLAGYIATPLGGALTVATVAFIGFQLVMDASAKAAAHFREVIAGVSSDMIKLAKDGEGTTVVLAELNRGIQELRRETHELDSGGKAQVMINLANDANFAGKKLDLFRKINQDVASGLRQGNLTLDEAADVWQALEIRFGAVDEAGRSVSERIVDMGASIADFNPVEFVQFFQDRRLLDDYKVSIEGVITAQRDQGAFTKGEYINTLSQLGYTWEEIQQKVHDALPAFREAGTAVDESGHKITVFANKSAEEFDTWAKEVTKSFSDFVDQNTKYREAFKLTTKQFRKEMEEQTKIAQRSAKDMKVLTSLPVPQDFIDFLTTKGPAYIRAFVGDSKKGAKSLTDDQKALVKQAGLQDDALNTIGQTIQDLPNETTLTAKADTKPARDELGRLEEDLGKMGFTLQPNGTFTVGGRIRHGGGWAGEGPWRSGALKGDEVASILQKGEYVIQRSVAQQPGMMKILDAMNRGKFAGEFHTGGQVGATAPNMIQMQGLIDATRRVAYAYNNPPEAVGKVGIRGGLPTADQLIEKLIGSISGGAGGLTGLTPNAARYAAVIRAVFGNLPMGGVAVRNIAGTNTWSQHAYGNAIDVMTGTSDTLRKAVADFSNVHRAMLSIAHLLADPWYASPLGDHYNHVHADFNPQGTGSPISARKGYHGTLSRDTKFQAHKGERVDITPRNRKPEPLELRILDWKNGIAQLSGEVDWRDWRGAR